MEMAAMIYLDEKSEIPVYKQIYERIRQGILKGEIEADTRLPAIRRLASELAVSRNTVEGAYQQLAVEGYIYSVRGSGYFASKLELMDYPREPEPPAAGPVFAENSGKIRYEFSYGSVNTRYFPFHEWKRCFDDALLRLENDDYLRYPLRPGCEELRETLASYFNQSRGLRCVKEQIVITSCLQQNMEIISGMFPKETHTLAFEEPGHIRSRLVFEQRGYDIRPAAVREDGVSVDDLYASGANLVYITPSHQFPTGVIMPVANRQRILQWADDVQGYIIEDDYDSEFRYGTRPIPSLQGMDRSGRVIYIGSFSKSLAPDTRISYIVLPASLIDRFHEVFRGYPCYVPWLNQLAVSDFIRKGCFTGHINKMRTIFRKHYQAMLKALDTVFGDRIRVIEHGAGLHMLIQVKETSLSERELMKKAAAAGVQIYNVADYWIDQEKRPRNLFMLGFGSLTEGDIEDGIRLLKEAWFGPEPGEDL